MREKVVSYSVEPHDADDWSVPASINGKPATYLFDTGAWISVTSEPEAMRLGRETENPFATEASRPDIVRFVSILSKASRAGPVLSNDASARRGVVRAAYRVDESIRLRRASSDMKTISYLGQIDKVFGVPVTTRNWNTISAIVRVLKDEGKKR